MIKIRIDATVAGKAFSETGADEQAAFINAMSSELRVATKADESLFENQCCYISDELNDSGKRLIKKLAEFIKLREEA